MKKLAIIFSTVSILLVSCGEAEFNVEAKKTQLKELKSQLIELKGQIKGVEKELNNGKEILVEKKIPVRLKNIKPEAFKHYIEQPGTVNSKANVLVSAELGGAIKALHAKEGDWVEAGETIIELDSEIMQNNIAELELAVVLAKTTFERQQSLWDQKIGSELQYLQIQNQYEALNNKLKAAEAQMAKLNISAPISGFIEEIFLNMGELAAPGRAAFRIVNAQKVYVEADVAERYANVLKKNNPVNIQFKALGINKSATISFVGQVINPENRTFKVKINLNNTQGELKPNAVASLEIQDYVNEKALIVPSQIVKKDMRGDYLFVNNKGKAQKTYVEVGLSQADKSMILSGLKSGDQVIVEGYSEVVGGSILDIKK